MPMSSSNASTTTLQSKIRLLNSEAAVADKANIKAKRLVASLHSLQTQNELLHHENDGLRAALGVKTKHQKKSYKLDFQQRREHHGGAVF
ncbi:hypothetical protein KJE20_13907 [Pyrenophora tritici-repentis]|nr:hypothetical protein PtrSN001A_011764 [Pyrenophora tritici-repentis]KAI1676481.1 hypothetical protein KJE20_13907 [Pyrenophora tritici-repentis]PWO19889.1 FusA, Translation elongation factors (GTPase) [Pyrenophora tritici-repentis]